MKIINMHIHTNISDGLLSPEETIKLAKTYNCDMLAFTEHETIISTEKLSKKYDIEIIPGIELNTTHRNLHLLGYGIEDLNLINYYLLNLKKENEIICLKLIRILKEKGYDISYEQVKRFIVNNNLNFDVLDKRKIAKYLFNKGYTNSYIEVYDKIIGFGTENYIPINKIDENEAIKLIENCGGIAVLAHPNTLELSIENLKEKVTSLKKSGLKGIEVFNNKLSYSEIKEYKKIAKELKLLTTYGSDYHGDSLDNFMIEVNNQKYKEIKRKILTRNDNDF